MVDIHHHLLSGLDDGPKDLGTSVAMARLAAADGITHVVCTPHANGRYAYDRDRNEAKVSELRAAMTDEKVALTLGLGCDFHVSYDNVQDALRNPTRYTINQMGYLLVELPDYGLPPGLTEMFYEMRLAGMTPILTHPERNPTLQADGSKLMDWLRGGMLVQVTADSVLGKMGKPAERMAHQLLGKRWVHFLASDAHNTTSRPPRIGDARKMVEKKYGTEYARAMCEVNPKAVFDGEPMPVQGEPLELYEDLEGEEELAAAVAAPLRGARRSTWSGMPVEGCRGIKRHR